MAVARCHAPLEWVIGCWTRGFYMFPRSAPLHWALLDEEGHSVGFLLNSFL